MVWIPWTQSGDAAFGFSAFVLQACYSPAFNWTLETFAHGDAGDVDVLSVLEDFFRSNGFAEKLLGVLELLSDCSAAELDFGYLGLLL